MQFLLYRNFSNLVRPKYNYFGHAALIIRGDKLPSYNQPKSALIIRGKKTKRNKKIKIKNKFFSIPLFFIAIIYPTCFCQF